MKLVLDNIVNRRRFMYTACDILEYLFRFLCIRSVKLKRFRGPKHKWEEHLRKHYHYNEGVDKLHDELDVITLLKSMRRVKLLTQTLMTQTQKMVLKFQRKNLIESCSSSGDSDTNNKFDSINLLESRNPMMKLVMLSKLKKMITSYTSGETNLGVIDKRLLRGLFVKHIKDFDEEYREKMKNYPLLNRLKSDGQATVTSIE